ncbi:similar to M protein repeat protein [Plenodomus lingam JN3]|uniref:Similar to M protein repeat protein n=1 Tax=Leptosphaeria maculans (strain JN3 / isolate v23.1.3 / race Av1-4-5-6-7-8) TaxID=985895 RepID=E4ZLH4_LEPMJ|nr:similar to M protein repeat protein [Plenodomus lingam JN3]CBX92333.1 similar to M protein repeat protein [Plenodomus lingam JN3]
MSGKGWWNSAISGLESRLDTILAEDDQASARLRAAETATKQEAGGETAPGESKLAAEPARNTSRSRPNSRLQDRLAKAVNKGADKAEGRASSDFGSRPASPALRNQAVAAVVDTSRTSIDSKAGSEPVTDGASTAQAEDSKNVNDAKDHAIPWTSTETTAPVIPLPTVLSPQTTSIPSIVAPEADTLRQSLESSPSQPSIDVATLAPSTRDPEEVEAELVLLQKTYEQAVIDSREEVNGHLERIDALQSKLTYLSQQLASSSKAMITNGEITSEGKQLAEKDAQIAALMEEGQKLSKTEMKHLATIKKMRTKAQEQEKDITTLKQRLTKAEKSITEQAERAKRAEAAERAAQDKLKIVSKIEKDIELIRAEREEAGLTISELRKQLNEALSRAEDAEKRAQTGALEAEKRATASLKDDFENLRIEKKLAEDRAKRETQAARDEAKSQQEKAKLVELELRGEITNLETKLELLRSRTEEATSSATGDSQAKLLRQIETLQTQYSLASENWQGIETTLTSRVAALEKDRDEIAKRESDVRRKAREVNSKARRLEDELETINERARAFEHSLAEQTSAAQKLQARLSQAEVAAQEARTELERERKVWEAELQQKLEDEKIKWKQEMHMVPLLGENNHLRADSPSTSQRRHSPDPMGIGIYNRRAVSRGSEMPLTPMDRMFEEAARRPTATRQKSGGAKARTPELGTLSRQDSIPSSMVSYMNGNGGGSSVTGATMDAPSIHAMDHEDAFENMSSPHRTINDMISVSTVGAGPSVQLVERMSAAVRRLESEKATSKEELQRLAAQRDEAREEVVRLMREVEEKRKQDEKVGELEKRLGEMEVRYQTTLEMLGEKTERVEELEGDVQDLKKMYRELVQTIK